MSEPEPHFDPDQADKKDPSPEASLDQIDSLLAEAADSLVEIDHELGEDSVGEAEESPRKSTRSEEKIVSQTPDERIDSTDQALEQLAQELNGLNQELQETATDSSEASVETEAIEGESVEEPLADDPEPPPSSSDEPEKVEPEKDDDDLVLQELSNLEEKDASEPLVTAKALKKQEACPEDPYLDFPPLQRVLVRVLDSANQSLSFIPGKWKEPLGLVGLITIGIAIVAAVAQLLL